MDEAKVCRLIDEQKKNCGGTYSVFERVQRKISNTVEHTVIDKAEANDNLVDHMRQAEKKYLKKKFNSMIFASVAAFPRNMLP